MPIDNGQNRVSASSGDQPDGANGSVSPEASHVSRHEIDTGNHTPHGAGWCEP
jgi:hypothetical protein